MRFPTATFTAVAALSAITASVALAAPRKVMFEQFTASWCGPCQNVGYALGDLTDDYPSNMQSVQMHIWNSSYGFDEGWCESRADFYAVSGIPTTVVDGVIKRVGTAGQAADYSAYLNYLNQRIAVPSDVKISLTGEPSGGNNYLLNIDISVDPGAPSRSMVIHLGQSLDAECGYPVSGIYYYDTHMDHWPTPTITLAGGESTQLQHEFVLNSTAASNTDHLTFYCFAQEPGSNGSGMNLEIYNMGFLDYTIRPPKTFMVGPNGDFTKIQDAIDNSVNGDTILVEAGTYVENISFNGLNCTMRSVSGAENTVIDGNGEGVVVQMMGSGSPTFDGFTLQNGLASTGSSLWVTGSPTIENCIIRDNQATHQYVILSTGLPTISNTLLCNNSPDNIIGPNWIDGGGIEYADTCPDTPCPADLDGDGSISVNDVLYLISAWGTADGDVDGNGTTDVNDLLEVISAYGDSC